jgi:hypothetical protein
MLLVVASQFGSQVFPAAPKTVRLKVLPVNIAPRVAKAKEKPAGVYPAQSRART